MHRLIHSGTISVFRNSYCRAFFVVRKDKKNKKKQREHKESVHEVICEENGTEESEEARKPDILAQIRLDDKTMKGI